MKFYVVRNLDKIKNVGTYLLYDNWDDYGFKTNFKLYFFDGKKDYLIGNTKIAYKSYKGANQKTYEYLNESFDYLDSNFYSLGQEVDYYENLNNINEKFDIKDEILTKLNDISYNNQLYYSNKNSSVMKNSLMRWVSHLAVTEQFKRISNSNGVVLTNYDFSFEYKLKEKDFSLQFSVDPESLIPTNIHAIIGKNGSGKTHLIKEMLKSIKEKKEIKSHFKINNKEETSISNIFSKIMCISYSFFDSLVDIIKPEETNVRYDFWGFKKIDEIGEINFNNFEDEFYNSLRRCFNSTAKKRLWIKSLEVLDFDYEIGNQSISNLKYIGSFTEEEYGTIKDKFRMLSSGYKSVLSMITKIIDIIEEKTFIIIDEPESHLHPTLLANFVKTLSYILKSRNGVALIATHSPLVLREIPKNNCYVMSRFGDNTKIERPLRETYGASINTVMKEAFSLEIKNSGFYKNIEENIKDKLDKNDEILTKLGDEALNYAIISRYIKDEQEN